jgi:DNA-binding NtrC family response regulator
VLEDRVVDRLGGVAGRRVDLRIIAATNKVLSKAVVEGWFREDLYYRLKVFQIHLSPLRDRREDILPLAQHFLSMLHHGGRGPIELSPRAKELLLAYHWPGNIRELKHCIEEAALLSNGRTIYPENLPRELRHEDNPQPFGTLSDVEAQHIRRVLQSVNWNKRRASEMLGINRSTLYEKLRLYQIEKPHPSKTLAREAASAEEHDWGAEGPEFN